MNYKEVNQPQPLYNSFQYVSSQETHSLNSKKEQWFIELICIDYICSLNKTDDQSKRITEIQLW